ncbi:hypothetical protein GJT99_02210 (plasmid) [Enterobacteriaceae endosymbiont of Donacia cincticornis]|nr:hypothetical protein GJT99_02210 [Enterobacteriaceae endosymbiont of Donacia cincticornis]
MQVVANPSTLLTKVSESINLSIKIFDKHGNGVQFSEVKISNILAMDRQGYIRKDSGKFHFEDITNNKSYDGDNFISYTNKNGELKVKVSDPHGIGVRTFLKISADYFVSKKIAVIFTVPTSPNNLYARMYGHMTDVLLVNKLLFHRPALFSERTGDQVYHYLNEDWAKFTWYNGEDFCKTQNARLPDKDELLDFYYVHSGDDLFSNYGWPIVDNFNYGWTSSSIRNMYFRDPLHFYVNFLNGKIDKGIISNIFTVFCVQEKK